MANLFAQAIDNKELLKFALGDDEYLVVGRDGAGHSVLASWNQHVMEQYDDNKAAGAAGVTSMFSSMVGNSPASTALRIWPLIEHLDQYWAQRHAGWLDFDLGSIMRRIIPAVAAEHDRCRDGEGSVPLATFEATIARIIRNGGPAELA